MVAAFRRGTFGTGVVRGNGLAVQQSGVVSLGTVAIPGDTNFASNILLAKTTSVNTATNNTFLDSSSNALTITRNGTPTQGSFTPYWPNGQWSGYFTSTTNLYIPSITIGTSDFTIETWIYLTVSDTNYKIICSLGNLQVRFGNSGFGLKLQVGVDISYLAGVWSCNVLQASVLNKWTHVAFTRSAGVCRLFVNGVLQNINSGADPSTYPFTSFTDPTVDIPANNFTVGDGSAIFSFVGNISNMRLLIGTALYTASFTVPIAPLSAIANTQLLILQDNRFKDNSTNNFTVVTTGTPKIQAFQPFNPPAAYSTSTHGGSGYFNGSTSDKLSIASNASLALGTGDFTIEMWVYNQSTTNRMLTWPTAGAPIIYYDSSNFLTYASYGAGTVLSSSIAVPLNTWAHIAVCRASSVSKIFINGVQAASGGDSNNWGQNGINIGADLVSTFMTGYISNLRVVKGTAVYTSAFTPPTTPVTAIANTLLLTNFTNASIYDTTIQSDATTVGSAQVSTTQFKWSPTSMKFNGSTDWLITQSTSDPCGFGSGNFTIEFWLYLNSTGTQVLFDARNTSSSNVAPLIYYQSGLKYYTAGLDRITGGTLSTATWYYIALVRSSGTTKLYINGTQTGSNYTDANVYVQQANRPIIGAEGVSVGASPLNGYIQDLRITKGIARDVTSLPITTFSNSTANTYTPAVPDAPIIANITTVTNTSVKIGYMAPLLNGGSTITSYTAVSTPGGITGTSITSRSGTITVSGLGYATTYSFAVYATNAIGTSTYSASTKSITTPLSLGRIFILSDMDLALTDLVMLNTSIAGTSKAKSYALATIYGSD